MSLFVDSAVRTASPWLLGAAALVMVGLSGAAAWKVATWRAEASSAAEIAKLTGEKHLLELAIAKQNEAVAIAQAQTQAAEAAQAQAQQHAADLAAISQSRMDKLASAVGQAKGCGDVLAQYWELRK